MAIITEIQDLQHALIARAFPTITLFNRLETRPRTDNFARALKAEVRDALWMLTRQWQMGEFEGDDAGSPIFAKVHLARTLLEKYKAGDGSAEMFDGTVPLEAKVEKLAVPFAMGGLDVSLDIRLAMGRYWLKLLRSFGDFTAPFAAAYPVHVPDPANPADAPICAHSEAWSSFAAAAGRAMDGMKLYQYVTADPAHHAYDGIAGLAGQEAQVDALTAKFVAWFGRQFYQPQPGQAEAWEPAQLEYRFACSAPAAGGEKVFTADEYYQGHLDWYSFDIDPMQSTLGGAPLPPGPALGHDTQTLLPSPVSFPGMPDTRWWAFEDGKTNFGDVKPDTTDIGKLLLVEFALVYANDWFLIPYTLPAGSLAKVEGLVVTNVFGERTWVEAAGRGKDDDWQRWAMFIVNTAGDNGEAADTSLLVPPSAMNVLEGKPLDEVLLIRDEMANMVWGIERTIPLPSGPTKTGREAARELHAYLQAKIAAAPPAPPLFETTASITYRVMTTVPEQWIPFVPVHMPNDVRQTQLQRAAMPRILDGDTALPAKVRPRTRLLREGLDQSPSAAYFIHEEEVPRAGVRVTRSFQRARWTDGSAWTWLGARKQTGRGEGSSGLAFDSVVDAPKQS